MAENGYSQNHRTESHAGGARPAFPPVENDPLFQPVAEYPAAGPGMKLTAYVNAFRRRWVLIVGLGLGCGLLLAVVTWFIWGSQYRVSALLRVATTQNRLVFPTAQDEATRFTPAAYDIYKLTQGQLITTPFVLNAALRNEELNINLLSVLRDEKDQVGWLTEEIGVGFPGRAEIMEVAMVSRHKDQAVKIVNAVVNAYLTEVVEKELSERRERLNDLEKAATEVEEKVRQSRTRLKNYARSLGTGDPETLALKQRIAVQEWADRQRQLDQVTFALWQAQGKAQALNAMIQYVGQRPIAKAELDQLLRLDPMARAMSEEYAYRKMDLGLTNSVVRPEAKLRSVSRMTSNAAYAEQQLNEMAKQYTEDYREMKRTELAEELQSVQAEAASLQEQAKALATEVEQKKAAAESLGGPSVDVEMARADIESLQTVLSNTREEMERVRVELNTAPRVTLIQRAEEPETPANFYSRPVLTGLVLVLGFCLSGGAVLLWDVRQRLVSSSDDVSDLCGVPVAGNLPLVPRRQLGAASTEARGWKTQLTESVDGIAARLFCQAEPGEGRVVLITSAVAGEGKTSLAIQLATSIAHRRRSTVLVDCSLRRPAVSGALRLPPAPGVSEYLRRDPGTGLSELVRSTTIDKLSVVTAGAWDRRAVTALADESAAELFRELRRQYEFVVIDSGPLLSLADTRFISRHADLALLCVMRDVSRVPDVAKASDILRTFGIEQVEAAVVGAPESASALGVSEKGEAAAAAPASDQI